MNKAFVREPDDDGRAFCPRCGSLGLPVEHGPLDRFIRPDSRDKLGDTAWFCGYPRCEVAYFNAFAAVVLTDELATPAYPKDLDAPMCACFGFTYDDVAADAKEEKPLRIRELLAKSRSPEARCQELAADGRPCLAAVQELYMKLRAAGK